MKVITLAEVKQYSGIKDSCYDIDIERYLPIIDAKVKQITGNRFNYRIIIELTSGAAGAVVGSVESTRRPYLHEDLEDYLEIGTKITGTGIPDGTYIEEVFYNLPESDILSLQEVPRITLSQNATADVAGGAAYLGVNIAYLDIIAQGVMWLIQKEGIGTRGSSLAGRTMGPVGVQFSATDQNIDNRYGMPAWFVKGLPKYARGQ
jgi:hypothetical protein